MINLFYLLACFIVCFAMGIMSFSDSIRATKWYVWGMLVCSVALSFLWSFMTKRLPDKEAVFTYSMYWDGATYLSWFIAAFAVLHVKPTFLAMIGTVIILIGIVLVKFGEGA